MPQLLEAFLDPGHGDRGRLGMVQVEDLPVHHREGPFPEVVPDRDGQQPARSDGAHRRQESAAGLELVGHPGVLQPGDLSLMTRGVDADREHLGRSVDDLQAQEDGLVGRGDRLLRRGRRLRRADARDRDERRADGRRRAAGRRGPARRPPGRRRGPTATTQTSIDLPTDRSAPRSWRSPGRRRCTSSPGHSDHRCGRARGRAS